MSKTSKIFVPRVVAPKSDEKWWKVPENPCIPRYNGTVLPNCFVGSTEIITNVGVVTLKKAFDYCSKGNEIEVPTIDGEWRSATVQYFGVQPIYKVKLVGSTYYCTENHRWFTCNKSGNFITVCKTSELKRSSRIPYRMCNTEKYTHVISIKRTKQCEGVYCVVEPITHSFTLSGGEITGNCVGYAHGRFCEILGEFHPDLPTCNAGDWIDTLKSTSTSLTWGSTPKLGAVAVWKRPGKAGHVAVVEYIYEDGTIMLSESGYSASWSTRFWNSGPRSGPNWYGTPYEFQGFIYNPGTEQITAVAPYSGGVQHGTAITADSPRYVSNYSSSEIVNLPTTAYNNSVDHPARKFVRAAVSHLGSDGYEWVKEITHSTAAGWSAAMCCAAGIECRFNDIVLPDRIFSTSKFCENIVEQYGGKYIVGGSTCAPSSIQIGDIFAISQTALINKYTSTHIGIVRDIADDTILTVECSTSRNIVLNQRRLQDIAWFVRPDWTKVGGTAECTTLMATPLYSSRSSRSDAILREVGFINNNGEPSITSTGVKLSAINYTTMLGGMYDVAGYSNQIYSPVVTSSMQGTYSVDATQLQPPVVREIFEFFINKGLSAAQAVGFLANIQQESTFNTAAVNSSGAVGLCQWMGTRKTNMIAACGTNWSSNLTGQLEFLWSELNGDESSTLISLREITGNDLVAAKQSAEIVLRKFERPGNYDVEVPRRNNFAESIWNQLIVTQTSTGTFISAGTSTNITTRSGAIIVSGSSIIVPSNVKQTGIIPNFTNYEGFFSKWAKSSIQRKLADIWDSQGRASQYYIATINGYYLIALSPKFGTTGDIVSVVLDDGTYFNCILGDAKGPDAQSEWGHMLTKDSVDIVEWEAVGRNQDSLKVGLQQAGWAGKKVSKIVNYGSWING